MVRAPLRFGDPITIAVGAEWVMHAHYGHDVSFKLITTKNGEGIRWIRDHHDKATEPVQALLAAWMLRQ